QNIDIFVNVIDKGLISRDAYRDLTVLEAGLPREYNIANIKKKINEKMGKNIPIFVLDIKNSSFTTNEASHIIDKDIEKEILQYVEKVGYRPITNILVFIIPDLVKKNTLNKNNPIVHLCISGDRQNMGRKIKYVMITYDVLDDILNIYRAECHYTIVLYPSGENYETLQNAMEPIINELHTLEENGLELNGIQWEIIPYFCFNTPNVNYFCSWCLCTKKNLSTRAMDKVYTIEKSIDQLKSTKPPSGYRKAPLLPMISLKHYVPNELHIMLRIWDRLWSLVIQDLESENQYNDHIREIICTEMH
ncbi:15170_t:CDS:2, partial [Gigaspora margarita]